MVLQSLNLPADRAMYVGDNPTHDIDPSNAEGMITVRIRRSGRHADTQGATKADHEVRDFYGLREILQRDFQVAPRPT